MNQCAVVNCPNLGRRQICPFDGRYHGHGCIHYSNDDKRLNLEFKTDGWYYICDEHYNFIVSQLDSWRKENKK